MSENIQQQIDELRGKCLQCQQCDLAQTRTHVVFGEGPGATEDATGRPFVGRSGKLLDEALAANKMSRRHVFIGNVVKCRACLIENERKRNRPPSTQEIETCTPWLETQIGIIKPLVILCLGAPAAKFIIKKDFRMTKERGIIYPTRFARYAIAALHPAYILRQAGQEYDGGKSLLIADIDAARRQVIKARKEAETNLLETTLFG